MSRSWYLTVSFVVAPQSGKLSSWDQKMAAAPTDLIFSQVSVPVLTHSSNSRVSWIPFQISRVTALESHATFEAAGGTGSTGITWIENGGGWSPKGELLDH